MKKPRTNRSDRRGSALVLVAVSVVVLLGMGALAVDLGAAFAWRAEAQKIADASALAGGSAFLDMSQATASGPASDRAYEYALRHTLRGQAVDSSEVTVQVRPDSMLVRVRVARPDIPVWFARVLGINDVDIGAVAAARAMQSGAARCLWPIALPDIWDDPGQDTNGNNVWDPGEDWTYDAAQNDRYQRYDPNDPNVADATGYGSQHRQDVDRDYGRPLQIKAQDPNSEYNASPGIFFPWRLPGGQGASWYRDNLTSCNDSTINLGQEYPIETGNMVGPTFQGVGDVIDMDPDVYWEPAANGGKGGPARPDANSPSGWTDVGTASPRVVRIALFRPDIITKSGMQNITFNNFAMMFVEEQENMKDPVRARFMYFVSGEGASGPTTGSLVLYLRLVE